MRSKVMPRILRLIAAICGISVNFGVSGCVHPIANAGRDADASIAALRANLQDLNAALVQVRTDIRAGGNVQQNDSWTMRLLGVATLLLGLSYPIGKLVWLTFLSVRDRARVNANLIPMSRRHAPSDDTALIATDA